MTRAEKAERNELMREYKSQGHTMQEVADKFGMSKHSAQMICKGIAPQHNDLKGRPNKYKGVLQEESKVARFIESRMPEVEYVGNYTGADGRADIKCKTCGTVFNRSMISIRKGHCSCPTCRRVEAEKILRQQSQERAVNEQRKAAERLSRHQLISLRVCVECGALFIPKNINNIRCSEDCIHKATNRSADTRLNRNNVIDKDITLTKLYKRDGGVCYLCGRKCDWTDYITRNNGTVITGNNYPSIEHVIPLSKGGLHSWDNVMLACRGCNTKKNAKILEA